MRRINCAGSERWPTSRTSSWSTSSTLPLRPACVRRVIFVDRSFWIAQRLPGDPRHATAVAIADAHATAPLLTSSAVVGKTWTFLRRRTDHRVAMQWRDRVLAAPGVAVAWIDEELEREAWDWLRVHDERPYSFVEASSFALMRRQGIHDALAFDGDFASAGFTELRP